MKPADYSLTPRAHSVARIGLVLLGVALGACGPSDESGAPASGIHAVSSDTSATPPADAGHTGVATDASSADTAAPDAAVSPVASSAALAAGDRLGGWRLQSEASPYLREHADNPVDWFPWGPEAFERARALDRPVFLSIGYSSCHWCHVMERESFMDPGIAGFLNDHFVSIKVDREQRPDIDGQYLRALHVLTDGGGWPANLFLTPDAVPFAGGTYFPPEPRFGLPGFHALLEGIDTVWSTQREELVKAAGQMRTVLAADDLEELLIADGAPPPPAPSDASNTTDATDVIGATGAADASGADAPPAFDVRRTVSQAAATVVGRLDLQKGGNFGAPKFPPTLSLDFLLRQHQRHGVDVLPFVEATLVAMDRGGLHDHIGGGFHRYCVDEDWQVPHFEKPLPDNALLATLYAQAFAITGQARWADVARSTLAWMAAELRSPEGLYYGALDADSLPFGATGKPLPGAIADEGRFYLWRPGQITQVLGEQRGAAFAVLFGVTEAGNFVDGASIPRPVRSAAELALDPVPGVPEGDGLQPWIDAACADLARARAQRPHPMRDEKCLAGWNGLTATAFARAGALLDDAALRAEAGRLAQALLGLVQDGRVAHQRFDGANSGAGSLFDHAAVARGLLDAYAVAPDPRFVQTALALGRTLLRFQSEDGDFFETESEDALLPARSRELFDGALPTGSSVALETLLRLSPLDDSGAFEAAAERAVARLGPLADKHAVGLPGLLTALDHAAGPLGEIVLDGSGPDYEAMLRATWRTPLPAALVLPAASALARQLAPDGEPPALLAERTAPPGGARAWVCVRRTCLAPAEDATTLAAQLSQVVAR